MQPSGRMIFSLIEASVGRALLLVIRCLLFFFSYSVSISPFAQINTPLANLESYCQIVKKKNEYSR
jgi:hypothetical protein